MRSLYIGLLFVGLWVLPLANAQLIGDVGSIQWLQESDAICLDGTPGAYYFAPGSAEGKHKWVIWHEGGGFCTTPETCWARSSRPLGSSQRYQATMPFNALDQLTSDETVNPMMYNWNRVYIKYCDGASYSGNAQYRYQDNIAQLTSDIHMKGFPILTAVKNSLVQKGFKNASAVLIGGCSAGGLAVLMHIDWWRQGLSASAHVVGFADSAYFLDHESPLTQFVTKMKSVFALHNISGAGVHRECHRRYRSTDLDVGEGGEEWKCMFARYLLPLIRTPVFIVQSKYDSYQKHMILNETIHDIVNQYAQTLTSQLISFVNTTTTTSNTPTLSTTSNHNNNNVITTPPQHGLFLDACARHCGLSSRIRIGRVTGMDAFIHWYHNHHTTTTTTPIVVHQDAPFPCPHCCGKDFPRKILLEEVSGLSEEEEMHQLHTHTHRTSS
eukprot:TRINITY_DN1197_c1_g1_i3.p1 TRINITY_DN1197_c1_g1~~TRINITY_DN1197_c1_g1_i3.p1  ORF type:complete len:440 (+),score=57.45 TRINITY_DN1197_c1_g1_i3:168-1487(+)